MQTHMAITSSKFASKTHGHIWNMTPRAPNISRTPVNITTSRFMAPSHYLNQWWFIISWTPSMTCLCHYDDIIMDTIASQITSLAIVYSIVYSSAHQRKHQSSASLAFVWGIHRGPVNSPHKGPVTRKMFPFDDVIMCYEYHQLLMLCF